MIPRNDIGIDIKYDKSSLKTYKRIIPGQFVIHLRSFQGGFAWSNIEGIVSPAYTVIEYIDKNLHVFNYWKELLTSRDFIKHLESVTYGVRDGRSISFTDFSSLYFKFPSQTEQEKIGRLFNKINTLITVNQRKAKNHYLRQISYNCVKKSLFA
ncbi:hypothetical protein [Convivina intestini]|uniref:hypothetical protein n=1 Tax=Convivina intestini TaxID=1505726 RepID=UPI002015A032|nr:hypothetical protein R078131_01165 [Convivina intestini]